MVDKLQDLTDAFWRALERAHDLAETLRAHRLFPSRKVFSGAVATALGFGIQGILRLTGVDLGPLLGPEIPPIAGWVTAYFFTDGPAIHLEEGPEHGGEFAIGTEERVTRTKAAAAVAAGTTASSHAAAPPRSD